MSILKIRDENGNIVEIPALKGDAGKSAYEYAQEGGYTGTEAEFRKKLSSEWVNKSDLETEVTNQLDGAKADIVQELINQLQGLPVFGTVNDDNTITVTSALADGTYTLMYENEDGTTTEVGTITVGNEETIITFTNLADITDEMWVTNYRINSSGNTVEVTEDQRGDDTIVMTNLIDISSMSNSTKIHLKSLDILSNGYARIYFYDSNKNYLTFWQPAGNYVSTYLNVSDYNTDVQIVTKLNQLIDNLNLTDVSYIRFGGILTNTAENVIITFDQEIPTLYTNQLSLSTDADGNVYNGTGYKASSRYNSSAAVVDLTSGTLPAFTTGFIPIKVGDIVRFKNCWIDSDGTEEIYGGNAAGFNIYLYDSTKTKLTGCTWINFSGENTNVCKDVVFDEDGNTIQFTWKYNANTAYVRFTLAGNPENAIITVNEEII